MKTTSRLIFLAPLLLAATVSHVLAAPTAEEIAKAQKTVKAYLEKVKGTAAKVEFIKDEPTQKTLPKLLFFAVRFPQYPVARLAPAGLASSNVFAVAADDTIKVIKDPNILNNVYKEALSEIKTDDQAKDAVRAYLRLFQELHQDGFYKFALMDDSTKLTSEKGNRAVTGKVVVMGGGNGDLTAAITFDGSGSLTDLTAKANLKPGPRPICQATKLLDPDPIVRAIAEQDLLYMGRPAKDYLDEQRAKATPALQAAIDRLWQRICEQDR